MIRDSRVILDIYNTSKPWVLPETAYGPSITIDPLWCVLSRVDIMPLATIMRIKQYPQLCKYLVWNRPNILYWTFRLNAFKQEVEMLWQFCAENKENTIVPLRTLTVPEIYMWI